VLWVRLLSFSLALLSLASAQSTASLRGSVVDPAGGPVANAQIRLENLLNGFVLQTRSTDEGRFSLANIPFHSYTLRIEAAGFEPVVRTVSLLQNVPQELNLTLQIQRASEQVEVHASEVGTLVEPEVTGTRAELNARSIQQMPVSPTSRGLESVLVSFSGFAANANGAIHPRGAHNQMTFVVDGMPISDQLTGAFANAVDTNIVQTVELLTGNIPAEYGSKVSGVAVITTKTGLGSGNKANGSVQLNAGQFDTLSQVTQIGGGNERWGYFASLNTMKTNRYLDQVSLDNLHNGGNSERGFFRLDFLPSATDQLRFSGMIGRSSFELANLRSQHAAGQRQRQLLRDLSFSAGWLHTLSPRSTFDAQLSYRTSIAQLFGSPGDTPVSATQDRHLSNVTSALRWSYQANRHLLRAGFDWQHFPVSENFTFAITDPSFNAPDLDEFNPSLVPFDLSRGGDFFRYGGKRSGNLYSGFAQDTMRLGRFTLTLGMRYDAYRFLATGNQMQPRVGIAYHLRETGTVFRASYNRVYQTPPNENLLLSSSMDATALVPPSVREALGNGVVIIRPERQDVYEGGLQQAIGSWSSLNLAYYYKGSRDLQDNDNFFNTGVIFPTSLSRSRTRGAEARWVFPGGRGLSGSLSLTHYRTIVTPPFTGGLFLGSAAIDLLSAGPFVIDHDQLLGAHGLVHYQVRPNFWISSSVRYDSGLVSNPSDPAEVAADPDYSDLLPYVNLNSDPARVRPRTIVDVSTGYEKRVQDRRLWELTFQVTNLTNRTALYNFQSIFVGTRLVQPRTAAVRLRFFF
jgi:hypothetical protein